MWIYLCAIICLLLITIYKSTKKPNRFPPGPPRLPIIGSLPYIITPSKSSEKPSFMTGILQAFSKYGPIVGFYIGNEPQVAIADFDMIKGLMKRGDTASRPKRVPFQDFRPGSIVKGVLDKDNSDWVPGILLSSGKAWTDQRRFTLKILRDFGFGKSSMEDTLLLEVEKLCEVLKTSEGKPLLDIDVRMNISILNALWAMLTGEKLPLNDPKLQSIVENFHTFANSSPPSSAIASMFPIPEMIRWSIMKPIRNLLALDLDSLRTSIDGVADLAQKQIQQHKSSLDADNINDFIDAYLVEIRKNKNNRQSSFNEERGYFYLVNVLIDLFVAGMETTSSALTWAFLLLLHHPETKRKIQGEIDTVIGRTRSPGFSDKDEMHYINAFLLESYRIVSFGHHSIPHYALSDIPIVDYVIPKGAGIFPSLISVMYDPNHFPDPHNFQPERFLDSNGKFKNNDHVIPFGVGKRTCLGKTLAEKEYFLFLVGILQKFDIASVAMQKLPSYHIDYNPPKSLTRGCPKYDIIFSVRT